MSAVPVEPTVLNFISPPTSNAPEEESQDEKWLLNLQVGLGYGQASSPHLALYRPQNHVLGNNMRADSRAIEFFCRVAAPSLSGPIDPYFWTNVVLQFCDHEPAVRHSIMTISSLFENLQSKDNSSAVATQRSVFALKHYNAAIRELQTPHKPDIILALLTCLMFVCIEVLQSNGDVAIRHCHHGMNLINTSNPPKWVLQYLLPIFRRMSILPFYFGNSQPMGYSESPAIPESFSSHFQAQNSIDAIYNMTIQHFRRTADYRLGDMRNEPATPDWKSSFERFEDETPQGLTHTSLTSRIWLFHVYEVCMILSRVQFVTDETDYDAFIPNFTRMIEGARELAGIRARSTPSEFHFEMGFAPYLFFAAIKCRVVAQRIVDLEHGISGQDVDSFVTQYGVLPPDEMRVRHFVIGPAESGSDGPAGRELTFYMTKKDGGLYLKRERFPGKGPNEAAEGAPGVFEVDLEMDKLSLSEIATWSSTRSGSD
ncbi:transcriptional regulatory [Fusarium circinatum]|uniref:Transcriptional regulatory n=1 Tax=Fusarium circinatum TaxID=48490 RepID=A0A8H6CUB6_FUSCI|nr:transcriptional regulatory [Fusarium circinatum]